MPGLDSAKSTTAAASSSGWDDRCQKLDFQGIHPKRTMLCEVASGSLFVDGDARRGVAGVV